MTASHVSDVTDTGEDHGHGTGLYIALVPWVLFTLLAQHSTLKVAAVVALIAAVGIMIRSITKGGLKLLELGVGPIGLIIWGAKRTDAITASASRQREARQ